MDKLGFRSDLKHREVKMVGVNQAGDKYFDLEISPDQPISKIDVNLAVVPAKIKRHKFIQGERPVVSLLTGDSVCTDSINISSEHVFVMCAASSQVEPVDGQVVVQFQSSSESATDPNLWSTTLCKIVLGSAQYSRLQEVQVDLSQMTGVEGRFRVVCESTHVNAEWLIACLRICRRQDLGFVNARSSYKFRLKNEIQNFSGSSYTHEMYGPQIVVNEQDAEIANAASQIRVASTFLLEQTENANAVLANISPMENEAVFNFAMRCLATLLPQTPPNFFERAAAKSKKQALRILSICCGAARVEEMLLGYCQGQVEFTLLDASEDLIGRAAQRLKDAHSDASVICLIGDINDGLPGEGQYDIIVCVSALHHVVKLELVLSQINERLSDEGEFWSIGEQIGRNGNRLWPDAFIACNDLMAHMPSRLLLNAHTKLVDTELDDRDYSVDCFEGIRSEELESKLDSYLLPVDVYKRNAFLWRLVDTTYADNYSLRSAEDVKFLKKLVVGEALHWVSGGRSTELHAIYRKRQLNKVNA
jgi:SAM-dependent methyltransferase